MRKFLNILLIMFAAKGIENFYISEAVWGDLPEKLVERKDSELEDEKQGIEYEFVNEEEAKSRIYEKSKTALICEADVYALPFVGLAKKAKAGIIGVDNSDIIGKAGIKLDSVTYDMSDMIKTTINYIMGKEKVDKKTGHYVEYLHS